MEGVKIFDSNGQFFPVLQETSGGQTAIITVVPGADAGPQEVQGGDQIVYTVEGEAVVPPWEEMVAAWRGASRPLLTPSAALRGGSGGRLAPPKTSLSFGDER
jgi:hypothetical protein